MQMHTDVRRATDVLFMSSNTTMRSTAKELQDSLQCVCPCESDTGFPAHPCFLLPLCKNDKRDFQGNVAERFGIITESAAG